MSVQAAWKLREISARIREKPMQHNACQGERQKQRGDVTLCSKHGVVATQSRCLEGVEDAVIQIDRQCESEKGGTP